MADKRPKVNVEGSTNRERWEYLTWRLAYAGDFLQKLDVKRKDGTLKNHWLTDAVNDYCEEVRTQLDKIWLKSELEYSSAVRARGADAV